MRILLIDILGKESFINACEIIKKEVSSFFIQLQTISISDFEAKIANHNFKDIFPFIPDETDPKYVELLIIYVIKEEENSIN